MKKTIALISNVSFMSALGLACETPEANKANTNANKQTNVNMTQPANG